jgi:hypothetical protein
MKCITVEEDCDVVRLGNVCEVQTGEYITKNDFVEGIYPVYGGGNVSNYINKKNRKNSIVINKDGLGENCVKYVHGDFFLNHHGWTLKYKTEHVNYVNYWLLTNQNKIYEKSIGTNQKGINQIEFYSIVLKLPKNKDLITKLQSKFDEIEKLQMLIAESANEYKTLISQLKEEISLKTTKKINENNESKNDKIKANTQQKTEQNDDIIVVKPKNKKRNNGTKTDVKVDDQNIEQNK